jgi:hypothetical protein
MDSNKLIEKVLKSIKPSDVFNVDWKKDYLSFSKLIHPDTCNHPKASDAMAIINEYKDIIVNGKSYADDSGEFKLFEDRIEYEITDINRDLLRKSFENFKKLVSLKDPASQHFRKYLPESMVWTSNKLIIKLSHRTVLLTHNKIEQKHVNWLFSRMFELSLWLRQIEFAHMGLNPTSVGVVPETHGITILSFYHLTPLYKKATTISAKYKSWYPTTLFTKKVATHDIDLELCKKIAIYLLGDRSAAGTKLKRDKDVNQAVLTFLLTKHDNTTADYDQYRKILKNNFDTKKFYELNL